ncbi:uncharacterized protein BDR25DRAFT_362351 [Lindgomyces ingoldianus]|uniref:Uncharacterized protein n=1 Tax=Lindgomyces ingoldianus TaxID=673940 RepID=A0ACB6QCR9_9PLEO|nr:uncharacterized protein BDR25DRAFT_362351 [Lindgomyces ingoldianus]KAF2463912.1 hypothetical protein BDR25DRAFT_362351 [Lindgomyces ingoldianus]
MHRARHQSSTSALRVHCLRTANYHKSLLMLIDLNSFQFPSLSYYQHEIYFQSNTPGPTGEFFFSLGPPATERCFPSAWYPDVVYSPGVCPIGYTAVAQETSTVSSRVITEATCCPRYITRSIYSHTTRHCFSKIGESTSLVWTANGKATTGSVGPGDGINAWGIKIQLQGTGERLSSSTALPTTQSSGPQTSLIIGVSVAGGVILLAALAFLIFFYRFRKRGDVKQSANLQDDNQQTDCQVLSSTHPENLSELSAVPTKPSVAEIVGKSINPGDIQLLQAHQKDSSGSGSGDGAQKQDVDKSALIELP